MSRDELTPDLLLRAYAAGIFPMSEGRDDPDIFWVDPTDRGVLPLDRFHLSRSMARTIKSGRFTATLNQAFGDVVHACADRTETWINPTIETLYQALHGQGHAHSLEVWEDGELAGGVYGVALGGAFFGESMFSARRDGSKAALCWLVDHLSRSGYVLFDTQFLTPHLARLGAVEIPRDDYRAALSGALTIRARIDALPLESNPQLVVQRMTQTS